MVMGFSAPLLFQNCSGFQAGRSSSKQKLETISEPLFAASVSDPEFGMNEYFNSLPAPGVPVPGVPSAGLSPVVSQFPISVKMEMPVKLVCSMMGTTRYGGNLVKSSSVWIELRNKNGDAVCTLQQDDLRENLISRRRLVVDNFASKCSSLVPGDYDLVVRSNILDNLLTPVFNPETFDIRPYPIKVVSSGAGLEMRPASNQTAYIAYGGGTRASSKSNGIFTTYSPIKYDDDNCDLEASPLLIHLNLPGQPAAPIELSSPYRGINFDILGGNSLPQAHQKVPISWIAAGAARGNYFIVLPDSAGAVNGIDEMFGDNTLGPDGQYASNGYEALAKWDGRRQDGSYDGELRDGFISSSDPIFQRLRLWSDSNVDGIAQSGELHTLRDLKVAVIDLVYDPTFHERDIYGNQILMRSEVKTTDGKSHVMFDIWFRLLEPQ